MIAALGTLALAFVLMVQSVPFAHAEDGEPPLGDCFGGILSSEPLHCYLLEQGQVSGKIDIEAIYEAGNGIYVFLRQKGPFSEATGKYLRQKAAEFHESWPDQLPASLRYQFCHSQGISYKACLIDRWPWSGFLQMHLPWPNDFTTMVLQVGGADARLQMPGWASWRQVWPDVVEPRSFNALSGVDVSDVDLMNFPKAREINCKGRPARGTSACILWKRYPDSGVTAWYWADGKLYLQATSTRYPQKVCKQSGGVPSV